MKLKRVLALLLSVCMVLPFALNGTVYAEENETTSESLDFVSVDSSEVDVNLTNIDNAAEDLALEQELVDENGMVEVIIVMEGESVIEEDASAVLDDDTQEKMAALEENQAEIIAEIESTVLEGEALEIEYNYTWLLNGVAATVPYSALADIEAVSGVKQVFVAPVYQIFESTVSSGDASTMTVSDGVMVGRESTWASGYTGEGIKIAVIDTGLDTDHQNFQALSADKLTEDSASAETVAAVLGSLNASSRYAGLTIDDVYYSTKVVFGFNYSDNNLDITHENDEQGDHGTHVAGIAAANKVEGSNVVGVAPDAQLYILKVFGNKRSGSSSDIIAALEDALILGADVVNMSLGSNAGFTSSANEFIDSIYARVAETNTVLSVSAGNNYTSGYGNLWGTNANTTSNPDNAVIGEPGVYQNVLSVASVENWKIERNYIDVNGYQMAFVETSASYEGMPLVSSLIETYGIVYVPGYGAESDYEGLDVTGKIVLVQRGVESFVTKCENAAAYGAVACFVFNNTSGEFYMNLTDCTGYIPCVSITMADGEYIRSLLDAGEDVAISFPTELASIPSINAYEMSEFSSWGVAPDLSLEPDITAPGGNIYSTINDGEYGLMSGTSMAAPNISGISALVMQYVKANFDSSTDYRTMVQNLLVSTSTPLTYGEDGLFYSPRSQGSGLANAYNSVTTHTYLTVDGVDSPKAELGDDADKTGSYSFTFDVTNFGSDVVYYTLNTVVQSEGYDTVEGYEGIYFMSSTPVSLEAVTAETSNNLVQAYDMDANGTTDSHDAYLIYQAVSGSAEDENWTRVSFRYDTNYDDAVNTGDVQAYLNALVGLDGTNLNDTVLQVAPGETATVSVSVDLTSSGKAYLDTYFENGGYVEGFTFLTAKSQGDVDLSLPFLGFYGSWDFAPILDDGDYWDLLNSEEGEIIGNQYYNVLFSNFYGYESYVYPGYNVYVEEAFDPAHIAVSPNGDGYFDTVDDIYTSLLRNAAAMTYRYTNVDTGEIYYEQTALNVSKSVYASAYSQIIPNVYTWYEGEIDLYDWTDANGNDLENGTTLLLEIEATGSYEGATPDIWSVPIFVDLEAPELLSAVKTTGEDGTASLELTFKDNHYVSAVALMSSNGSESYYVEGIEDPEANADGSRTYTATFDVTGITGKMMILLGDYAMNQAYFALNMGGEGAPYGELVAYQYNFNDDIYGWISFNPVGVIPEEEPAEDDSSTDETTETTEATESVPVIEETQITMDEMNFVCAEYVNGFIFAQTETGAFYGFRYEDMLKDTFDLELFYITQLENVYQDLAYNYADGKLYGLFVWEDGDYPYSTLYSINIDQEYVDEITEETTPLYAETWAYQRGGIFGLGLACDDNGTFYILSTVDDKTQLWTSYESSYGTLFKKLMDIDVTTDYLQSIAWDHNTETLYWARFQGTGVFTYESELYNIDVDEKTCTFIGSLSGETCAMFAPLSTETAAKAEHSNLPVMDTSLVAAPVLRDVTVTMNVGSSKTLIYDLDPWYSDYRQMGWSSSDESVVTVDQSGNIVAVGTGSAIITVANVADPARCATCAVEVTALDLKFQGVISTLSAGLNNTTGTMLYEYSMENGISTYTPGNLITATEELDYGLDLATSCLGRGSIWACEYNNTGMIYQIDAETGEVLDVLQPVDGDMLFGMTYNETLDTFTGIMNMYLYVDLRLTHDELDDMLASRNEEQTEFTYHKLNLLPYLLEANDGFITGEYGQGASSEIVMCGITSLNESYEYVDTYFDYLGNSTTYSADYTSDQTLVILDNVGRLWYIDEIVGMTKSGSNYVKGSSSISANRHGVLAMEDANGTYSVFYIRQLSETPMTDMFRQDSLPRITYHFSDIEYAGKTAEGAPMYAISMYDYWNEGITNELYLYVSAIEEFNYDTYETITLSEDKLYDLGDTGKYNVVASIHSAEVTGGVDEDTSDTNDSTSDTQVNGLFKGRYHPAQD